MSSTCCPLVPLFRPLLGISWLALCLLGCSGRGDVTGKVTYQKKPLVFGSVLFEGSDRSLRQGNIEKDGSYSVRGVAVGEAHVAVNSANPKGIMILPPKNPNKKAEPYPDAPGWFPIPNKYESPSTSGLTYTIKRGQNHIDIELK